MTGELPPSSPILSILPAAYLTSKQEGGKLIFSGQLPRSKVLSLLWHHGGATREYLISKADYQGDLVGEAIVWSGTIAVTPLTEAPFEFPLVAKSTTLRGVKVDGKNAPIFEKKGRLATLIEGRREHLIELLFEVPVEQDDGLPSAKIDLSDIPAASFSLRLPGERKLIVDPAVLITSEPKEGATTFRFHLSLVDRFKVSWQEAIPVEASEEVRTTASLYHLFHAEDGVLWGKIVADSEVSRGEAASLSYRIPAGIDLQNVDSYPVPVADWRVSEQGDQRILTIYFQQKCKGKQRITLTVDRSISNASKEGTPFAVPLIEALDVHRQRGLIALLTGSERHLKPSVNAEVSEVGENQIPDSVKDLIEKKVSHTFKYLAMPKKFEVVAISPERSIGRFDAAVYTLQSVEDIALKGLTTVEVSVKSGGVNEMVMEVPERLNLLGLTAPSLREYKRIGGSKVRMIFTKELEGIFKIDLRYEEIIKGEQKELSVPFIHLDDVEVEQGRIGIEALSALELSPIKTEDLSSIGLAELPRLLVAKTSNPILLAFKYIGGAQQLTLGVVRHPAAKVQEVAIESARYYSLITADGTIMTKARFLVRNNDRQFLKLLMSAKGRLWSAKVAGVSSTPAIVEKDGDREEVLVRLITSPKPFEVEVLYQAAVPRLGFFGSLSLIAPQPDIVALESEWNLLLPSEYTFREWGSTIGTKRMSSSLARAVLENELKGTSEGGLTAVPFPEGGGQTFSYRQVYAEQNDVTPVVSLLYLGSIARVVGIIFAIIGAVLIALKVANLSSTFGTLRGVLAVTLLSLGIGVFGAPWWCGVAPVLMLLTYHRVWMK